MREILTVLKRPEERVYLVRSLETGEEAVMFAAPIRLTNHERWSWRKQRVVNVHTAQVARLRRIRSHRRVLTAEDHS